MIRSVRLAILISMAVGFLELGAVAHAQTASALVLEKKENNWCATMATTVMCRAEREKKESPKEKK